MIKKILTMGTVLLATSIISAQEIQFSGDLSAMWGVNTRGTDLLADFTVGETNFTGTVEAYQGDGSVFAEGTITFNALTNTPSFDLNEAYIDYSSAFWGIRLGLQQIAWGKADGINITNVVFPEDSSKLYQGDGPLGINALRFSLNGNTWTCDALWIPVTRGTVLPLNEGNKLKEILIPSSIDFPGLGSIPVTIGSIDTPEVTLKNSEYGLKLSGYLSFCDISLYGFYGWDKTPLMNYALIITNPPYPDAIKISGEYSRLAMIGIDAAFPIGATVLRLETAFFPDRKFQSSAESILNGNECGISQNQIMALTGIDWMPSGWTITAQYYCDAILNKSDNLERENAFVHGATLSISKTLLQETLELSFSGLIGLNDFDSAMTFETNYSLTDQIKLSAGTYIFLPGPQNDGTYGKFKDLSTFFIKGQYKF